MYENPEPDIEPTASTPDIDDDDDLPTLAKAPDEEVQNAEPNVVKNADVIEQIDAPTIIQKNDLKLDEIKIVSVASAVTEESILRSDEQDTNSQSIQNIKNSTLSEQPESTQVKPADDRNETRVISLDTIIRKGLNEQMPMTAKDIDNIVPNAIKQQQDASLKQSEKIASEKEFALVYESSDDYNSSGDEKFEDELTEDVNVPQQQRNDEEANKETDISEKAETAVDNDNENHSAQSICEALLEDKTCSDTAAAANAPVKDVTEGQVANESNDSATSDHSFDDFDSESDSTHSSHKKQKRRKSTTTQNKVKDDVNKKSDELDETGEIGGEAGDIGEDMLNDPGPRLNRRGKPRKSYDETDSEQVKKKVGRKLNMKYKVQRYSGPKRPGVRVSQ